VVGLVSFDRLAFDVDRGLLARLRDHGGTRCDLLAVVLLLFLDLLVVSDVPRVGHEVTFLVRSLFADSDRHPDGGIIPSDAA